MAIAAKSKKKDKKISIKLKHVVLSNIWRTKRMNKKLLTLL